MALSVAERKHLMPFGAQKEVAAEESVDEAFVTRVLADEVHPKTERGRKSVRRVRVALARKIRMRVDDAFAPLPTTESREVPIS